MIGANDLDPLPGPRRDEADPAARPEVDPRAARRRYVTVIGLTGAAVLGVMVAIAPSAAVAVTLLIVALPLLNAKPVTWIAIAIAVPWLSRLITVLGTAPRFIDFLDFPLVVMAFTVAMLRHLETGNPIPGRYLRICRWLILMALIVTISWAFNDADSPQRLVAGMLLVLEPFLLLAATVIAPMTRQERQRVLNVLVAVLCVQLPFSLVTIAGGGVADAVKGTLLQAGAGHHVSAAGLVLGFFLLAGLRVPKLLLAVFGVLTLVVIAIADAKQVMFALPLAVVVLGITQRRKGSATSLVGAVLIALLMAGASTYALITYPATQTAIDFIQRASTNRTGKIAAGEAIWHDLKASPASLAFGLGPGESVSRFAFLTTTGLMKAGSPIADLGIKPSRNADRYNAIAFSGPFTGDSSFTSAQSSAMGVFGDYGLIGGFGMIALIGSVVNAIRRYGERGLRAAALAAWTMAIPLAVIFDWLEQPPFTLALMVMSGLALRRSVDPGGSQLNLPGWVPLIRTAAPFKPPGAPRSPVP